jgi:hypothetical protein
MTDRLKSALAGTAVGANTVIYIAITADRSSSRGMAALTTRDESLISIDHSSPNPT